MAQTGFFFFERRGAWCGGVPAEPIMDWVDIFWLKMITEVMTMTMRFRLLPIECVTWFGGDGLV